jgi:integrase
MEKSKYIETFLASRESPKTQRSYNDTLIIFNDFCKKQGIDLNRLVSEWREARLGDSKKTEIVFVDLWQDLIRAFHAHIKPKYASLSTKQMMSIVKSFFKFNKIPVDVEIPKRTFVSYHNRDLNKNDIRLIVSRSSARNRALWLILAESGMRVGTAISMKYWWIKEDFEKKRLPMRINIPSEYPKDHVGDRWTFIGEDGFKNLQEYLKPRQPLKDDDYVFASEKPGKMLQAQHSQFSISNVSVIFGQIVRKLKLDQTQIKGKPGHIRLHGLRKYFRNNCRAEWSYREFWMGHNIGTDEHYVSRNPEDHYQLYSKVYDELRVLEPSQIQTFQVSELKDKLKEQEQANKDQKSSSDQIQEIRKELVNQQDQIQKLTLLLYSLLDQKDRELEEAIKAMEKPRKNNVENTKVEHLDWESAYNSLLERLAKLEERDSEEKQKGELCPQ